MADTLQSRYDTLYPDDGVTISTTANTLVGTKGDVTVSVRINWNPDSFADFNPRVIEGSMSVLHRKLAGGR